MTEDFLLIPVISIESYECPVTSRQWVNTILSDINEEGGKKLPIQTALTGLKEYDDKKVDYFLDLFWRFYESFDDLKEKIGEKFNVLPLKIKMKPQFSENKNMGVILYRGKGIERELGRFKKIDCWML